MNLINASMQARYNAPPESATPELMITLKRSLEALNAILKEFVNIKLLGGIRICAKVYVTSVPCRVYLTSRIDHRAISHDPAKPLFNGRTVPLKS